MLAGRLVMHKIQYISFIVYLQTKDHIGKNTRDNHRFISRYRRPKSIKFGLLENHPKIS